MHSVYANMKSQFSTCALLLLTLQRSHCMIYLEEINGAILYDTNESMVPPEHFLTNQVEVITANADDLDEPSSAPSTAPSPNNIFDRQLYSDREMPSVTYHESDKKEAPSRKSNSIKPFNDLHYVKSSLQYVYYDSKQARFGTDLGPRGNFEVGNLVLPPRGLWGSLVSGGENDDLIADIYQVDTGADELEIENLDSTAPLEGNDTSDGLNETFDFPAASDVNSTSNATSLGETKRGLLYRLMKSIDEFLGLAEPADELVDKTVVNSSISIDEKQSLPGLNETTNSSANVNESFASYNLTLDNSAHISDYFCLEDFVEWKTNLQKCIQQQQQQQQQQQKRQVAAHFVRRDINQTFDLDNSTNQSSPPETCLTYKPPIIHLNNQTINTTTHYPYSNPNYINSTRPLTILALRGRCSFESKAQMAMLLNEIMSSQGKSNRIAHIIVYNNLTADSDEEDELIDMGLASQTIEQYTSGKQEDGVRVGMVYVNSSSGRDLIRRMLERGMEVGLTPYLNVTGLFVQNYAPRDDSESAADENARSLGEENIDVEESTKGEYNDTITSVQESTHDVFIVNGWFFPATLTKFCLNCGPERNYGFEPSKIELNRPQTEWDQGWFSGGWEHPPGERPPSVGATTDDSAVYDPYNGSYYVSQEWVETVRKFMISVLVILLIGPFVFAAWRWRWVGGTVRLARDENGARHVRVIAPNMEDFVNGQNIERNGTKLDRAQVFALPEMEYVCISEDGASNESGAFNVESQDDHAASTTIVHNRTHVSLAQSPPTPSSSPGDCLEAGVYISSTCCSICIEEFEHGEKLRILPRCSHAFHTECILPWLTERQGCCPLCKTPVLPDEYQRNRRTRRSNSELSNNPRNRMITSIFGQSASAQSPNEVNSGDPPVEEPHHSLEGSLGT